VYEILLLYGETCLNNYNIDFAVRERTTGSGDESSANKEPVILEPFAISVNCKFNFHLFEELSPSQNTGILLHLQVGEQNII
jgi:hypothetical protein